MQSFSASTPDPRPRLLVVEPWGLGDLALAVPFMRAATVHARVTLLAKPHAEPLVRRFCPDVELLPFTAPWTAFRGKYRLSRWPWLKISALLHGLQHRRFDAAVSARPDPRDHLLMALAGANARIGFARAGSTVLLTDPLARPGSPHRFAHWQAVAAALGWNLPPPAPATRSGRHIVIHTGAAQPTRAWPDARYAQLAARLQADGWQITMLDAHGGNLDTLIATLATADRFIGNDSGPGHVAALLGVPTFTIFGAQLAANFHPLHPQAAWVEGAPCPHKPCNDYCRFPQPDCILGVDFDTVWSHLRPWLVAGQNVL